MVQSLNFYRGLAVGLTLMYVFDPDRGRTRRALFGDKTAHGFHTTQHFLGRAGRDLRNRAQGAVAKKVHRARHEMPDDRALVERVRAKLGRYVSHPHAIQVEAHDGQVVVSGPILRDEVEGLISAVSRVRGASKVINQLELHERGANTPALQGGVRSVGERPEWAQSRWTPGLQLIAGILGVAAIAFGASWMARLRGDQHDLELESEMPEYAMLR